MAKAQQDEIPMEGKGVAPIKLPKIDKLARAYVEARDDRIQKLTTEIAAKGKLLEALHFHRDQLETPDGVIMYHYDDQVLTVEPGKEKLKITARYNEPEE